MKVEADKKNDPSGARAQRGSFFVVQRRDSLVLGFWRLKWIAGASHLEVEMHSRRFS